MTSAATSYYQDINTLVRFFTREEEGGYVFAVAEHQGIIPQINQILLNKVQAQNKHIHLFTFDVDAENSPVEQLRAFLGTELEADALIVNNLDDCLRKQGKNFLQELNFSREALHTLGVPLLFWVTRENLALISNHAADLFSQRRLTTIMFEADETLLAKDIHLENRFTEAYRSQADYEALTLKINLLKKQLQEAENSDYARPRIAREIALPLASSYAQLDLYSPALELMKRYNDALPKEDADILIGAADIYFKARLYEDAKIYYSDAARLMERDHLQNERLSYLYVQLGDLYYELGNFPEAEKFFDKNLTLSIDLVKQNPNKYLKKRLAIAYERLGTLWQNKGDFNRALEFFEKQTDLFEELYRDNPQNESLKNGLAISYSKLGDLWKNKGDFNRALDFFEKRAQLGEELYQANPQNENLKNGLAISYSKLGDLWKNKGDFTRALEFFEKCNQLQEELYYSNPQNEKLGYDLCISYERLGGLWQAKGDFEQALEFFEKLNTLIQKLHLANPQHEQIKNELAISYNKLGLLWLAQQENEKAMPYMQQALQLMEAMVAENPHRFTLQNNRCFFWRDVGRVLVALDRKEEALALYEQAAAGWQALWEQTELPQIKENLDWVRARIAELSAH